MCIYSSIFSLFTVFAFTALIKLIIKNTFVNLFIEIFTVIFTVLAFTAFTKNIYNK